MSAAYKDCICCIRVYIGVYIYGYYICVWIFPEFECISNAANTHSKKKPVEGVKRGSCGRIGARTPSHSGSRQPFVRPPAPVACLPATASPHPPPRRGGGGGGCREPQLLIREPPSCSSFSFLSFCGNNHTKLCLLRGPLSPPLLSPVDRTSHPRTQHCLSKTISQWLINRLPWRPRGSRLMPCDGAG